MFRFAVLTLIVLICIASLSCQSYSTGLQQSVVRADETAAVAALHAVAVAQQTYSVSNDGNYGSIQQLRDAGYLDDRFSAPNGGVKGYALTVNTKAQSGGDPASFTCNADPTNSGPQAGRHLYVDSTSTTIHVNPTQPAAASDPIY